MDWIRRIFGLSDRQRQDFGLQRNPTWEEIQEQRDNPGWSQQRPPDFNPFGGFSNEDTGTYGQFHGDMYDPFSSMFREMNDAFGQMNQMFSQMDGIFSQMDSRLGDHNYGPGQIIISEFPGNSQDEGQFLEGGQRQAPRDQLLKVPDSSVMPDPKHPPYSGPERNDDGDDNGDSDFGGGGHHGFGDHFGSHSFDPMTMFENFFRGFGLGTFHGHPEQPMLPAPDDDHDEHHSRESLLKKDSDLDDRDVSQLPSDGPRYSYEGLRPGYHDSGSGQLSPGQSRSMFRSTTTVRIKRPDGTIREEKRYKDSTGREEVIVTDTKPDELS